MSSSHVVHVEAVSIDLSFKLRSVWATRTDRNVWMILSHPAKHNDLGVSVIIQSVFDGFVSEIPAQSLLLSVLAEQPVVVLCAPFIKSVNYRVFATISGSIKPNM